MTYWSEAAIALVAAVLNSLCAGRGDRKAYPNFGADGESTCEKGGRILPSNGSYSQPLGIYKDLLIVGAACQKAALYSGISAPMTSAPARYVVFPYHSSSWRVWVQDVAELA